MTARSDLPQLDDKTREKIESYKKSIENYKQDQETFLQQLQMLKTDIKLYKSRYDNLLSYDGRISSYSDLKTVVVDLIDKFKPK
jgi:hypothetical protein